MRQLPIARTLLAFALITMVAAPVLAGPPLVCFPYDIGTARSLPWDTKGHAWRGVRADYPLSQLTGDTLALLTPATPVIVRMETLRRAALYATKDLAIARALLTTLLDRARAKRGRFAGGARRRVPGRDLQADPGHLAGNRGPGREHRWVRAREPEPGHSRAGARVRGGDDDRRRPPGRVCRARAHRPLRCSRRPAART
jgi:hypothetical protein